MRFERWARKASFTTLVLFFVALVMSNASRAGTLVAGGSHAGEDHSFENHRGETLTAIVISDATFEGSNLRDSILDDALALRTDFTNAQLRGTSFQNATLTDAVFAGAGLRNADFTAAFAAGADFSGANFRDATMAGVSFDGASLNGANVNGASFAGASFLVGADLRGLSGVDPSAFAGAFYDFTTLTDPGFDTSQMVLVPEPKPIVYIMIGLVVFALLPSWADARAASAARA